MKNIIIGTAGHIDHGKTSLIKALTGIETDRLKEEKKRGITIELGFAHIDLDNGERVGIVDVPGHEKFIKNMLAGAGGVDMVLLVIAADEGIMPQTREHLDILSLLNTQKGIVVLTKVDMVDTEWLELVKDDIESYLSHTFLSDAPIYGVSSHTGEGIDALKSAISEMVATIDQKNTQNAARIPIDRVFTIDGFGTVITGTQIEGTISVGDNLMLYPQQVTTKVKSIQVHGQSVETAFAGQRVALNLTNLKVEDIKRGNTLAKPETLYTSMIIDIKLNLLESLPRPLENRTRVRFYNGTNEVLGRLVLLDDSVLNKGENAYAQLRLEETVAVKVGDPYVIRYYSPLETIGGGIVLDVNPDKHKRFKEDVIEELLVKDTGNAIDVLEQTIQKYSKDLATLDFIALQLGLDVPDIKDDVDMLCRDGLVFNLKDNIYIHKYYIEQLKTRITALLTKYHNEHPLKKGMLKEEFRQRIFGKAIGKISDVFIKQFVDQKLIGSEQNSIYLASFKVSLSKAQQHLASEIIAWYKDAQYTPQNIDGLIDIHGDKKNVQAVVDYLVKEGELVKVDSQLYYHADTLEMAKQIIFTHIEEMQKITLAEFRDKIGASRKYAIALLEHFDRNRITKKIDDYRIKF